jgi:glycosyltransferase involved in cell wall biosynthesis
LKRELTAEGAPERPRVSLFFPVYQDEHTVRRVTEKALKVLADVASEYEVIIVDDGSPDRSGEIADEMAQVHECVRVVHHPRNLGYGAALQSGFSNARFEWICGVDGDDQYEILDLYKLIRLKDHYDLIITFRYVKVYSGLRIFVSWVYNRLVRALFRTPYRDISTGLRLVRKSLLDEIELESSSPFVGAELAIKTMLKGYRVGELGIQTFPREFGRGESVTIPNIVATLRDLLHIYRSIYSPAYERPESRRP